MAGIITTVDPGSHGVTICCGLARPRYLAGAEPAQVTASHGPGIETCSRCGNVLVDA
ncbi:hypothetical protein THIOKS11620004 [Thiocapsa sp. KS1]|nr:hypothetical protein THIOKS11620004 [Thiocapsa sp. KS1]